MSKVNDGGPAFPSNRDMRYEQEFDHEGGMTLRQYAAIKLRVAGVLKLFHTGCSLEGGEK